MMRVSGAALAVSLAVLLVCCSADPHQEQDGSTAEHGTDRYDSGGPKARSAGGGGLMRQVRESRHAGLMPYFNSRRYENNPYSSKQMWTLVAPEYEYYGEGLPKRNFDEIDRSGLDNFVRKRNFDEIDQTSMPFPYSKRFYHMLASNYLDAPVSIYDKKRTRPDYPMDEIDLSHFPIGSKRSMDSYPLAARVLR